LELSEVLLLPGELFLPRRAGRPTPPHFLLFWFHPDIRRAKSASRGSAVPHALSLRRLFAREMEGSSCTPAASSSERREAEASSPSSPRGCRRDAINPCDCSEIDQECERYERCDLDDLQSALKHVTMVSGGTQKPLPSLYFHHIDAAVCSRTVFRRVCV
jgi:hypothetical protein